ncbi:hypothetical protein M3Y97_00251000 [Aphelenchoides bicaudatus]|nr:hypothetical protein M3Y97_00251000 [Aphelenchoides bicaudatus]
MRRSAFLLALSAIAILAAFSDAADADAQNTTELKLDAKTAFQNEAVCRVQSLTTKVYIFCAVFYAMALLQLGIIVFLVVYVRKMLCASVESVVEKTHALMDAVLVVLIPQSILAKISFDVKKKKNA